MTRQKLREWPIPEFTIIDHDVGFVIAGSRNADEGQNYWRITQFMLPAYSITPPAMPGEIYYEYTWVPANDASCWIYVYAWHPDRAINEHERARFDKGGYGQFAELGPDWVPLRNRTNDYLIDRDNQKHRTLTGVHGIAEQDTLAHESQGLIADRSIEHLTPSDVGVVHFKRLMLAEARTLTESAEPVAASVLRVTAYVPAVRCCQKSFLLSRP